MAAASGERRTRGVSCPTSARAEPREARRGRLRVAHRASALPTRTVAGRSDSSSYSSPRSSARTAARTRWGSRGLTRKPSAPLRRARKTSGRRSSEHQHRHGLGGSVGLEVAQLHGDRHAAHGADLEVGDDEVDAALAHARDGLGAGRGLFDEEVGPGEHGLEFAAQRGEVTGEKDGSHGFQRSGAGSRNWNRRCGQKIPCAARRSVVILRVWAITGGRTWRRRRWSGPTPRRVGAVRALFFYSADSAERKEDRLEREQLAKRICAGCGVREECLRAALDRHESYGIWGGLNEFERRALTAS